MQNDRQRGTQKRKRKKIIVISGEGKFQTEKQYFTNFNKSDTYRIKYSSGNETDPVGIVEKTKKYMLRNNINLEDHQAYCFIDLDDEKHKDVEIKEALKLAEKTNIHLVLSNPCFEYWFLLHFKNFFANINSSELEKELLKYCPNYKKGIYNIYDEIKDNQNVAVKYAKEVLKNHKNNRKKLRSAEANPFTEV